jgi:hypothetical protein
MKKRVFLWMICFFVLSMSAYAVDPVETSHQDIISTILPDGTASFYLYIDNNQEVIDTFKIVKPFVYWSWLLESESVQVFNGDSEKVMINFTPFDSKDPGEYGIKLDIESMNNASIETTEFFEIKVVGYDQVLSTELNLPDNINPNKDQLFRIQVINNYDISVDGLKFVLFSEYFEGSEEFNLRPYETVDLEIPVQFDGTVREGDNDLLLKFYHNDILVLEKEEIINIGYFTDVAGKGTPEESFLYSKETVVRTNTGNIVSKETYMKRLTWFEKLFTSTNPAPGEISKEGSSYVLTWEFDLQPDQTRTIVIETSYRGFVFAIILAIFLFAGLYYWLKRDVSLEKKVISMKKGEHGYYSMNIVLSLKNKTLKDIRNLKIMDRLAGRVEEVSNYGAFKPSVFKSESGKSTKLVWNLPKLGKREEVLLQYTMRYKPHIIRSMPPAVAKYLRRGNPVLVKSNRVEIFS